MGEQDGVSYKPYDQARSVDTRRSVARCFRLSGSYYSVSPLVFVGRMPPTPTVCIAMRSVQVIATYSYPLLVSVFSSATVFWTGQENCINK